MNTFAAMTERLQRTLPDARVEIAALPNLPQLRLGLINADFPTGPLDADTMRAVIDEPAYWAFCWGSGLALARLILDEPSWVRGKSVVDLGSGSGIAAIAAAKAGARSVIACDSDADACWATRSNASHNGVTVEVTQELPDACDILLMADVLYDKANLPLLEIAQSHAREILVADSRVTELPDKRYAEIMRIDALTYPNLGEFDEFGTAHIFHWTSSDTREMRS